MFKLPKNYELIITLAIIGLCLFLAASFPAQDFVQKITANLFFFAVIPFLYIKYVLRKNFRDFGITWGDKKMGTIGGVLMLLASLLIAFIFVKFTSFPKIYYIHPLVRENFGAFVFNMLIIYGAILLLYELFFRGFVMFYLEKKIGFPAAFFQFLIYALAVIFSVSGDFEKAIWQIFPFAIASLLGGPLAIKSRSIIYSFLSGLVFIIILNGYLIYAFKN